MKPKLISSVAPTIPNVQSSGFKITTSDEFQIFSELQFNCIASNRCYFQQKWIKHIYSKFIDHYFFKNSGAQVKFLEIPSPELFHIWFYLHSWNWGIFDWISSSKFFNFKVTWLSHILKTWIKSRARMVVFIGLFRKLIFINMIMVSSAVNVILSNHVMELTMRWPYLLEAVDWNEKSGGQIILYIIW